MISKHKNVLTNKKGKRLMANQFVNSMFREKKEIANSWPLKDRNIAQITVAIWIGFNARMKRDFLWQQRNMRSI